MKTKSLNPLFIEILSNYGLGNSEVLIVESVKDWAVEHGINELNGLRIAMTVRQKNTSIPFIIIKDNIVEDDMPGVLGAMQFSGFRHYSELMELRMFVIHTFLHEVAHGLGVKEEKDADEWAWKELNHWLTYPEQ